MVEDYRNAGAVSSALFHCGVGIALGTINRYQQLYSNYYCSGFSNWQQIQVLFETKTVNVRFWCNYMYDYQLSNLSKTSDAVANRLPFLLTWKFSMENAASLHIRLIYRPVGRMIWTSCKRCRCDYYFWITVTGRDEQRELYWFGQVRTDGRADLLAEFIWEDRRYFKT